MTAICIKCKHMQTDRKYLNHMEYAVWYNFTCNHFKPKPKMDYVTGKMVQEVAYCRDHNKEGKCFWFEEKKRR